MDVGFASIDGNARGGAVALNASLARSVENFTTEIVARVSAAMKDGQEQPPPIGACDGCGQSEQRPCMEGCVSEADCVRANSSLEKKLRQQSRDSPARNWKAATKERISPSRFMLFQYPKISPTQQ